VVAKCSPKFFGNTLSNTENLKEYVSNSILIKVRYTLEETLRKKKKKKEKKERKEKKNAKDANTHIDIIINLNRVTERFNNKFVLYNKKKN
jgi:Na+/phosphate symporter